jgi:hypothetical protein
MNKLIYWLKSLKCMFLGHDWSAWEDQKFINMSSRKCGHCKLCHSHDFRRGISLNERESYSLAVGSNWPAVSPWRK